MKPTCIFIKKARLHHNDDMQEIAFYPARFTKTAGKCRKFPDEMAVFLNIPEVLQGAKKILQI
ncbi:MAG: hypothetical protein IJT13_00650 [Bacteroidaceae bacterium]|nr:hypothetical protein [Bacteroidaceae bacterium]